MTIDLLTPPTAVGPEPGSSPARRWRVSPDLLRLIGANLCRGALWFLAGMLVWGVAPIALGWHSTTVMTGSMEPLIPTGSIVVIMPVSDDALTPGRVVQSDDPDRPGTLRLHRITRIADDGSLVTKGDANEREDSSHVTTAQVHGVGVILVPYLGIPVKAAREGDLATLALCGLTLGLLGLGTRLDRKLLHPDDKGSDTEDGSDSSSDGDGSDGPVAEDDMTVAFPSLLAAITPDDAPPPSADAAPTLPLSAAVDAPDAAEPDGRVALTRRQIRAAGSPHPGRSLRGTKAPAEGTDGTDGAHA